MDPLGEKKIEKLTSAVKKEEIDVYKRAKVDSFNILRGQRFTLLWTKTSKTKFHYYNLPLKLGLVKDTFSQMGTVKLPLTFFRYYNLQIK